VGGWLVGVHERLLLLLQMLPTCDAEQTCRGQLPLASCQHWHLVCLDYKPACMPIRLPAPQIVFSEGWWVGSAEDNPEENRLPDPDWLAADKPHTKFDYSGRGGCAP
jgi:hypothetical protein